MTFHAIGLMSGTSLDGLDICYARFEKSDVWKYEIIAAKTLSYSDFWEKELRTAVDKSAPDLLALHSDYGFFLGKAAADFIAEKEIENVDVIASHGHTVFHQPGRKFTLQIGDGRAIRAITNVPVVYDFRSQDVLSGGNGAPLVPIGDKMLFAEFDACLNIGGFSNISFDLNKQRLAFDICPVNTVLNPFAKRLGAEFDDKGKFAASGLVNAELLQKLNALEFYKKTAPKSLGTEWVFQKIYPLLSGFGPLEVLATFTEHAAIQISKTIEYYKIKKILCTGGGTYNDFLISKIHSGVSAEVVIPQKHLIEFKEALVFAFMGVLRFTGENNVLSSATGSSGDHCSGLLV